MTPNIKVNSKMDLRKVKENIFGQMELHTMDKCVKIWCGAMAFLRGPMDEYIKAIG